MTPDVASSEQDGEEEVDEPATLKDVGHAHPETGETFEHTGVHARGKYHPDDQPDASENETDDPDDA